MRFLLILFMAVSMFSISSMAAAGSCSGLVNELKAMREAQSTIQSSLVGNHEMFASTLESYSEALTETAGKVYKTVTVNMGNSAQSIRERGLKAQKMSKKLDEATEDLIHRLSKCLK